MPTFQQSTNEFHSWCDQVSGAFMIRQISLGVKGSWFFTNLPFSVRNEIVQNDMGGEACYINFHAIVSPRSILQMAPLNVEWIIPWKIIKLPLGGIFVFLKFKGQCRNFQIWSKYVENVATMKSMDSCIIAIIFCQFLKHLIPGRTGVLIKTEHRSQ